MGGSLLHAREIANGLLSDRAADSLAGATLERILDAIGIACGASPMATDPAGAAHAIAEHIMSTRLDVWVDGNKLAAAILELARDIHARLPLPSLESDDETCVHVEFKSGSSIARSSFARDAWRYSRSFDWSESDAEASLHGQFKQLTRSLDYFIMCLVIAPSAAVAAQHLGAHHAPVLKLQGRSDWEHALQHWRRRPTRQR